MFSIIKIVVFLCFVISFTVLVSGNGLTPIKKNIDYSLDNEILPFSERILRNTIDYDKDKQLNKITTFAEDDMGYRLPNTTMPELYTISIVTLIDQNIFNFDGLVRINIVALENTTEIILHSRQLTILSTTISKMSDPSRPIPIAITFIDLVTDFLTIRLAQGYALEAGERYFIEIFYSGILREDDAGFYRSSYVNENGTTVFLATTQFESTDARHGFPCYDEPAYKARFNLAITHGENYTAISNTNVQSIVTNFGLQTKTTTFEQTPLMSTYLIAFIISDFSSIRNTTSGITHRSFARPTAAHLLQLTLDTSVSTLSALEEYLNVQYTLTKMDQVGVPDFAAGAMENWGLVTYRESYFLFDEKVDSYRTKTGIVTVIAHEYAHQWFGNLVTPEWWTYIWLNEGFATLFEYFATDLIHPDWHMVDYFVVDVLQNVFNIDASETIRPMTHYVESPTDIDHLFDAIAYDKSGSVLRMIQNAITDATFRKGLNYYLVNRSFESANEEHLFESLQTAIREDAAIPNEINVFDILSSWSRQSGFPLLHVSRNYEENSIRIYQERYLKNNPITTENQNTWWIPYNFVSASNPEFNNTKADNWLPQYARSKKIVPTLEQTWTKNDWIIFNKQQTGYYRVLYDSINYGLIADELNYGDHARIHYLNRAQIIDDAFSFARTNRLDWTIPFDIIKYLRKEIEYPPWRSFTNHLSYLLRVMPGLNNYPYCKQFMSEAFGNLFIHTGIDDVSDEPMLMKYKRTLAVKWACYFGSEVCLQQANEKLNDLLNNGIQIHPNLQSVMYCAGARRSGTFLPLYNRFIDTDDLTERRNFISAMSCVRNEFGLKQLLELTQETENINFKSISERVYALNSVYQNSELGLLVSIQFLIDNNALAAKYFGIDKLRDIVLEMAQLASTDYLREMISVVIEMLQSNDSITMTTVNEANAIIFDNMKWHIFNGQSIDNWLNNIGIDDRTTTIVVDETTVDDVTTTEETEITTLSSSSKFNVNTITIFILFGYQYLINY